ncbi:hypothetical protein ACS0TY_001985 [Phlomoides rotata]
MDKFGRGYLPEKSNYNEMNGVGIGFNPDALLIIKLPDSRALRIMSRSLFFAMVLLALPSLFSMMRASARASAYESASISDTADGFKILPILLRDLVEEGLIMKGDKGFVLGATAGDIGDDFGFLKNSGIDLLTGADLEQKNVVEHQVFDFVFATSLQGIQVVDSMLNANGLVISPLGRDPSTGLRLLSTYKIVYLRRFESTVVAMRKNGASSNGATVKEALPCSGAASDVKRAALKGLEDVYLEPPRRTVLEKKSSFMSRKIKFLPDLLRDSLDEYPRRVFVSDDSRAIDWLYNNYPMRHQEFEVVNMEVGGSDNDGVSRLLRKNVRREDYVVMKAEAQAVEEMLKDETLFLVDELFLECKNQWQDGEGETGSKRAYWQCLALYGKVRDEGIAVHQWWN